MVLRRRWGVRSIALSIGLLISGSAGVVFAAAPVASFEIGAAGGNVPPERGEMEQLSHPAFPGPVVLQIGTSTEGRPINAVHRRGSLNASRTIVAVGVIHGNELHGRLVTDRLMTAALPVDIDLWIVPTMNPDGEVVGSHQNARGVDLNRNWPASWETGTHHSSGRHYSGVAPASEREVQVMMEFFAFVDPAVTVWYHSPWNRIDCNEARVGQTCLDYAAAVGRTSLFSPRPGTATDWLMTAGLGVSFVSEFAAGAPSAAEVELHVNAVLDLS